ncbi:MAG: carboxypeptidase regulatory-like domain-containing protein [Deltaproteobacteria bacterium]|nr:carboxypeptidase regulatory-like domain-containing protein [Deltaproteobacteria bacterium]
MLTRGVRRWITLAPALLAVVSIGAARAQGLDATGPALMPPDGDPAQPVRVAAPWALPTGNFAAGVHLEYVSNPLVQYVHDGGEVVSDPLIRHALGARLSVGWAAHPRFSLMADLPFRLTLDGQENALGPALGDASLWACLNLAESDPQGFTLAVVPYLQVPTGARDKYAGAGTLRGGGLVTGRIRGDRWSFSTEMGVGTEPAVPSLELSGGVAGRAGAAATWLPRPEVGMGVEARTWIPLSAPMQSERGSPSEVLATVRARHPNGAWILGGVSHSLTNGVGMGSWSGFVGVGGTFRVSPEERVSEPTILVVSDPDGQPVRGAVLSVRDTILGTTNAWGHRRLDPAFPAQTLSLSASGLQTTEVALPEAGELAVTLPWAPVPLEIRVVDQAGSPVDAEVTMHGPARTEGAEVEPGVLHYLLEPGTWAMDVTAPGMGSQSRTVVVPKRRTSPLALEVVLVEEGGDAVLDLLVTDPEGRPVEGAVVLLNGAPVGTTSTGGDLAVGGLAAADHRVEVRSKLLAGDEERQISLPAAETAKIGVSLGYAPGTVRLVARGPDGAVVDGLVRVRGPTILPPMPLAPSTSRRTHQSRSWWSTPFSPTSPVKRS